jgi:hypothetical protein
MRSVSSKTKKSKAVSPVAAILAIAVVVVLAVIIGWKVLQPQGHSGQMSQAATYAAGSRYKFVVDRWNNEVAQAKKQGRAPDERLKPRPTSMIQGGNRPLGMENMVPGSLATTPGQGGSSSGEAPVVPPMGR